MDRVDAHYRIGVLNRPLLRHYIKPQWGKQVRGISRRSMRGDTRKCAGIEVCRLPQKSGQPFRKVGWASTQTISTVSSGRRRSVERSSRNGNQGAVADDVAAAMFPSVLAVWSDAQDVIEVETITRESQSALAPRRFPA